jgi:hypothetical protein
MREEQRRLSEMIGQLAKQAMDGVTDLRKQIDESVIQLFESGNWA